MIFDPKLISRFLQNDVVFSLTLLIAACFLLTLTVGIENKLLGYDDVFEYVAYAKSFYDSGEIRNIAVDPSSPPVTNQLGVVYFIFLPLIATGMNIKSVVVAATVIAHINILVIFCLFYRMMRLFLSRNLSRIYLLTLILTYTLWAFFASPLNDGFQVTFFLLAFVFLQKTLHRQLNSKRCFILFLLLLIGYLFRMQTIILPFSLIIFYIFERRFRETLLALFILVGVIIAADAIDSFFVSDFSSVNQLRNHGWSQLAGVIVSPIQTFFIDLPTRAIGATVLGTTYFAKNGNFFYDALTLVLSLFIVFSSVRLFFLRRSYRLLVGCTFGSILFLLISPVIINRYLVISLPFLWIILHRGLYPRFKHTHIVIFFLTVFVTMSRFFFLPPYVTEIPYGDLRVFKDCIYDSEPILLSDHTHFTYFDLEQKIPKAAYLSDPDDHDTILYFSKQTKLFRNKFSRTSFNKIYIPRINMRNGLVVEEWGYHVFVKKKMARYSCFTQASTKTQ